MLYKQINPQGELADLDYAETNSSEIFKTWKPRATSTPTKKPGTLSEILLPGHDLHNLRFFGRKQRTCQPARSWATPAASELQAALWAVGSAVCGKPPGHQCGCKARDATAVRASRWTTRNSQNLPQGWHVAQGRLKLLCRCSELSPFGVLVLSLNFAQESFSLNNGSNPSYPSIGEEQAVVNN